MNSDIRIKEICAMMKNYYGSNISADYLDEYTRVACTTKCGCVVWAVTHPMNWIQ